MRFVAPTKAEGETQAEAATGEEMNDADDPVMGLELEEQLLECERLRAEYDANPTPELAEALRAEQLKLDLLGEVVEDGLAKVNGVQSE